MPLFPEAVDLVAQAAGAACGRTFCRAKDARGEVGEPRVAVDAPQEAPGQGRERRGLSPGGSARSHRRFEPCAAVL